MAVLLVQPVRLLVSKRTTSWSGSGKGEGRRIQELTKLNMQALPPMPRARVRIATIVKPGLLARWRKARGMGFSVRECEFRWYYGVGLEKFRGRQKPG